MLLRFDLLTKRISQIEVPAPTPITVSASVLSGGASSGSFVSASVGAVARSFAAAGAATVSMRSAQLGTVARSLTAPGSSFVAFGTPLLRTEALSVSASGAASVSFGARRVQTIQASVQWAGAGAVALTASPRDVHWSKVELLVPMEVRDGTAPVDVSKNRTPILPGPTPTPPPLVLTAALGPEQLPTNPLLPPGTPIRATRGYFTNLGTGGAVMVPTVGSGVIPENLFLAGKDFCIEYWVRGENGYYDVSGEAVTIGTPPTRIEDGHFCILHSPGAGSAAVTAGYRQWGPSTVGGGVGLSSFLPESRATVWPRWLSGWGTGDDLAWDHILLARRGAFMRVYVNGRGGTLATNAAVLDTKMARAGYVCMGANMTRTQGSPLLSPGLFAGFLSNFRLTVGESRVDPENDTTCPIPTLPYPRS